MKKKFLIFHFFMAVLITFSTNLMVAKAEPTIKAIVSVEGQEYTVGDQILLSLTVTHPEGYEVLFPDFQTVLDDFVVKSVAPPTKNVNGDGTETSTQIIDARLFATGTFSTPEMVFSVSDKNGNLNEVTAPTVSVTVSSVLIEGDTQLRDIKPQVELPYLNVWPWIVGVLVFSSIVGGLGYFRYQSRKRKSSMEIDNRSPSEIAQDELKRIESLRLPESSKFKKHYTLTSICVRQYLESTFNIPFLERATFEIHNNLKKNHIPYDLSETIIHFLNDSDLVKFSRFTPDVESSYDLLAQGRKIVELTMPKIQDGDNSNQLSDSGQFTLHNEHLPTVFNQKSEVKS